MSSADCCSASAWKLRMMRCRRTSGATARTSSHETLNRPWHAARARPARIRFKLARGLAPQRIHRSTLSKHSGVLGRVAANQPCRIVHHVRRRWYVGHNFSVQNDFVSVHKRLQPIERRERVLLDDLSLFFQRRIDHQQLKQESVQLRFGKRIGAFLFDWILCGKDQERFLQLSRLSRDRDRAFLHGF